MLVKYCAKTEYLRVKYLLSKTKFIILNILRF